MGALLRAQAGVRGRRILVTVIAHPTVGTNLRPAACTLIAPSPQVLIESRQGPVRNILNAHQLVDDCNRLSDSWQLDPASPIKRIQCRWVGPGADIGVVQMGRQSEVLACLETCQNSCKIGAAHTPHPCPAPCRFISFGRDPVHDLLATASADVLVAVHGAGCTNWFFMEPGSTLLEIR